MRLPALFDDAPDLRNPFPGSLPFVSPLLSLDSLAFRSPVPVGIDRDGEPVTLPLAGSSLLIGGAFASGVSSAAQHAAAAAVLDPDLQLSVFHSVDVGDWDLFRPLASHLAQGSGREAAEVLCEELRLFLGEVDARFEQLRDAEPEARTGLEADFAPRLVVVAEADRFLDDARHGRAIADGLFELARRGPRAGYALILTSHEPTRLGALRHVPRHRLALHTVSRSDCATILGMDPRHLGFEAADLPRQAGTGVLLTDGRPRVIRGYLLTESEIETVCRTAAIARAHHRR